MYGNMDVTEGSVYNQRRRYCVFYCRTDSPLGSETDKTIDKQPSNITVLRVKKNQLDVQLILSIRVFRQPLHVSGVSRPIIRRYKRMYTTIGTNCCIHTVV